MNELHNFFISAENIKGNTAIINGSDFHHLINVLRGRKGDKLYAITLSGRHEAVIMDLKNNYAEVRLLELVEPKVEQKYEINLIQAIPKGRKMDTIIEKATEFGVSKIFPVYTERVNFTIEHEKENLKLERWRRKAAEASKQCRRLNIPEISEIIEFSEILKIIKNFSNATKIIFWELDEKNSLSNLLMQEEINNSPIFLLVGPEGGFSISEVAEAIKYGFKTCSLGKWILRTETAGPFAVGLVSYILWESKR